MRRVVAGRVGQGVQVATPKGAVQAPLDELAKLAARRRELDEAVRSSVASARFFRATWGEIGTALGVSAQAAHSRYRFVRDGQSRR